MTLVGCGNNSQSTSSEQKNITINMYAQAYAPPEAQQPSAVKTTPATEMKKLAEEYHAKHPNVTINFIQSLPGTQDYDTWVRTKASGGQLPDIIWEQWNVADGGLPKGTLTNVGPYLSQPDPYVPGKNWGDVLNKQIMSETKAPDGSNYIVNGDYVGTATFYNKDAFKKAGITQMPTTWSEFIDACKKLKQAGYTPFAWDSAATYTGIDHLSWLSRLFYTNFYANDYNSLRYTGNDSITSEDEVIAIKKGVFGPKSEKWMAMWPIIKDFSQYWQPDSTGADSNGQGPMLAFLKGNVGMYFDGSWAAPQIKSADPKFNWGSFNNPYPDTNTSQYATNFDSSASIGGPSAAFQYGIATNKSDNTMTPAKEKACVDWLQFITTPEHDQAIVNQLGQFVPTVVGTKPAAGLENLGGLANKPLQSVFGGILLNKDEQDAIFRAYQSYLLNQTSLNDFAKEAQAQMNKAADTLIQQNHWDLSKYLNK